MTENKSDKLDSILKGNGSLAVAFSGGVDSSFLLYRAHRIAKSAVIALTIRTPYIPAREIEEATAFAQKYGIMHRIIDVDFPETIRQNPPDRCYICKKNLFTNLIDFAEKNGYDHVTDGSNADDAGEFRPGLKALRELKIKSPLMEAGLTKKEIRQMCHDEDLGVWDKPAMACLLTRIPYDTMVNEDMLRMIEAGEDALFEYGFPGTRLRIHGDVARIECTPGYLEKMVQSPVREQITASLKKIGFRYVSLDLEGYRTGSLNPDKATI